MAIVGRRTYLEQVRLNFAIYCDEKNLSKDERQALAREIAEELEWEADTYGQ